MAHNVPPTSEETRERLEQWAEKVCDMLGGIPDQLGLEFSHGKSTGDDGEPSHMFTADHRTLPDRQICILLGIPPHHDDCKCVTPNPITLNICVYDTETERSIEDSALVDIKDARDYEIIAVNVMVSTIQFANKGTI